MSQEKNAGLWGGRFEEKLSQASVEISESISFDLILYPHDIKASEAHAEMLCRQNIISKEQFENIKGGLRQVLSEIENGQLKIDFQLEDIHTHIEKRLTEIIGDDGKRLHTGRSRNDQVAVDCHLYVLEACKKQSILLKELMQAILARAEQYSGSIWAGYTHTQIAQPVLLSQYLLAYFFKFARDLKLLNFTTEESSINPLGAGAMAGANYPIDRQLTTDLLGFDRMYENSMDAVSNRDYQLNYLYFASRFFIHISRLCEDLILYSTYEFAYVKMSDRVTTGSSIMPQKKNPDICEILRGKAARVTSNLQALLVNLKGLPLTYNRDLQEDKIYLFDSVKQVDLAMRAMRDVIENCHFFPERVEANLEKGFSQATDVADYLVREQGLPFRAAHELTGSLVLYCEKKGLTLSQLSPAELKEILGEETRLTSEDLALTRSVERKMGEGSTSTKEVARQIEKAKSILAHE